ncbi:Nitrate transporter 1.2 [Heracleum sosnowskyi]|uniref:Nitrate transporter 1.2 n=1 Tax=Heracleum sosnowskyi TaxID=360622 RepID=A0AAD8I8I8_9APIA|nr:Nitrate transporter 1.2 [Heracleum sosnowskyi]
MQSATARNGRKSHIRNITSVVNIGILLMAANNEGVEDLSFQTVHNPRQGGYKPTIFVFVLMLLDNIGFVANMVSAVLYFINVIHFDLSGSANTTTNFLGTAFLLTLVGGLVSDSYMNRLNTCLLFGGIELLGYLLIIIQSHYAKLQPEACGEYSCIRGTKALLFYASIYLLALGGGGIRGSVPSLGADQFDENDPKESKHIASFFNWFLFFVSGGACIGVTVVVWVSTNKGWDKSFIISIVCTFFGLVIVALGKPYYRIRVPGESAFLNVLQVLVVAAKNRKLQLPQNPRELYELHSSHENASRGERIRHSKQFRLLDKAAVLAQGTKPDKWKVCTVTQVEEVKILTRMIPILLSTTLMNTCLAQLQTFSIQQGTLMNTKVGSFDVPAASIPVIPLLFMCILVPIYEVLFVPLFRKLTGHPNGISHLQRVGVGLVLSAISMGVAGLVEVKRRNEFVNHSKRISLFWLSYQYGIFGIADMFTFVGLMEFFYSEAPKGMKSLSTSFSWLSLSIGYYLSTVFVEIINSVTGKYTSSKRGWLEGLDMNKNHVELFYWFLAILSVLNLVNYVYWANWYKYKKDVPIEPIDQPVLTAGTPSNIPSPLGWSPVVFPIKQGEGTD